MYIPPAFQGPDQAKLFDFIEANSFGLLVSELAGHAVATHLPLLVRRDEGHRGQLIGHMARANPQGHELAGREVLAIFSGPHAYVSPAWYEADDVVPTWNYVAVHAYGRCELIDDERATVQLLLDYVATFETSRPTPWSIDASAPFFQRLARQIVAFRIEISRLEGKWKLGQNHSAERREKVAMHLAKNADPNALEIARLMRASIVGD